MNDELNCEQELTAIRKDLTAIRACLLSSGLSDAQEMAGLLRSAVERFRKWTAVGPVDRESIREIQRELSDFQPLFENAYALHSGWFGLLDVNQANGCSQYDETGQESAGSVAAMTQFPPTIAQRG